MRVNQWLHKGSSLQWRTDRRTALHAGSLLLSGLQTDRTDHGCPISKKKKKKNNLPSSTSKSSRSIFFSKCQYILDMCFSENMDGRFLLHFCVKKKWYLKQFDKTIRTKILFCVFWSIDILLDIQTHLKFLVITHVTSVIMGRKICAPTCFVSNQNFLFFPSPW